MWCSGPNMSRIIFHIFHAIVPFSQNGSGSTRQLQLSVHRAQRSNLELWVSPITCKNSLNTENPTKFNICLTTWNCLNYLDSHLTLCGSENREERWDPFQFPPTFRNQSLLICFLDEEAQRVGVCGLSTLGSLYERADRFVLQHNFNPSYMKNDHLLYSETITVLYKTPDPRKCWQVKIYNARDRLPAVFH